MSKLPVATRAPDLRVIEAARPRSGSTAAVVGFQAGTPATGHSKPLLSIVATADVAPTPPWQLYRPLVWRYWLLVFAAGIALWCAFFALL